MNDINYEDFVWRLASGYTTASEENCLVTVGLGLTGEAGELADHVKKHLVQGHPLDREYMTKELGDILWYLALCAKYLGVTLEDVKQINMNKLLERYPGGVFSTERSMNRDGEMQPRPGKVFA